MCKIGREEAQRDLATSRAALEDVRRVEAWMRQYPHRVHYDAFNDLFFADPETGADALTALGRALAQDHINHINHTE